MDGDAAALNLTTQEMPGITFYPDMLEGDLRLSLGTYASGSAAGNRSTTTNTTESSASLGMLSRSDPLASSSDAVNNGSSGGDVLHTEGQAGVIWRIMVQRQPEQGPRMSWTIFPSTGLLLPGERCLRCDTVRRGLIRTFPFLL